MGSDEWEHPYEASVKFFYQDPISVTLSRTHLSQMSLPGVPDEPGDGFRCIGVS